MSPLLITCFRCRTTATLAARASTPDDWTIVFATVGVGSTRRFSYCARCGPGVLEYLRTRADTPTPL